MLNRKLLARFALAVTLLAFAFVNVGRAWADEGGNPQTKKIDLVMNRSYEVFLGNQGVYMDNSRHIGTLEVKTIEPTRRPGMWHIFTQRLIDVRVYDKDGDLFPTVFGIVRVYFNLDKFQYEKWNDPESNMSIWYFDDKAGGWHKCVTHWEPVAGDGKGRLWCLVHRYALYGVAYTGATMVMKLIKRGVITVTPTP